MTLTIAVIIFSFLVTNFLGFWMHRFFHSPLSGPFYRAHLDHHFIQYPPEDLVSDTYRSSGKNNSSFYFTLSFLPLIATIILSHFILGISWWICICILITMIITGLLHDFVHDGFHLKKSFWHKLPMFDKWNKLHTIHHIDISKNFGIFNFVCDRIFGTYKE